MDVLMPIVLVARVEVAVFPVESLAAREFGT